MDACQWQLSNLPFREEQVGAAGFASVQPVQAHSLCLGGLVLVLMLCCHHFEIVSHF